VGSLGFEGAKRVTVALLVALLVAAGLAACAPREQVRGYMPDEDRLAEIKTGVHDRTSIEALLGSPSSVGTFEDKIWYYITRRTEKIAFFDEKAKEQQVVAVVFDDSGIVQEVRRYGLEDSREIDPVERETPTRGRKLTIIEQLLGNIGRFNTREGGP
jgi:outer membrane protein assembly factor BamE (lipoprotein component of BamABCDE complex)